MDSHRLTIASYNLYFYSWSRVGSLRRTCILLFNIKKMKKLLSFIVILFIQNSPCHCQDKHAQDIIRDVISDSFTLKPSYKSLPTFIQKYMDKQYGKKFKIFNNKFNSSDVNAMESTSRKLTYVGISNNYLILSYEHGGKSYHEHSIIFHVNNGQIVEVYNLITSKYNNISQLKYFLTNQFYTFQALNEI